MSPLISEIKAPNGESHAIRLEQPWTIGGMRALFAPDPSLHMLIWLTLRDLEGQTPADTARPKCGAV